MGLASGCCSNAGAFVCSRDKYELLVQLSQELKVHLFLCFELLVRFYDLIDKIKPTDGVGWIGFKSTSRLQS